MEKELEISEVYLVQHVHDLGDETEDVKVIGIYSTEKNANIAVARLSDLPGFDKARNGFSIDRYCLDEDNWIVRYIRREL